VRTRFPAVDVQPAPLTLAREGGWTSSLLRGRTPGSGRIERGDLNSECTGQDVQLRVSHTAELRLDFRQRSPAQIPAEYATPSCEAFLGYSQLITQLPNLRPDNVLCFGHAPISELDRIRTRALDAPILEQPRHSAWLGGRMRSVKKNGRLVKTCRTQPTIAQNPRSWTPLAAIIARPPTIPGEPGCGSTPSTRALLLRLMISLVAPS